MDVVNAILKPVADTLMVPVMEHLGYIVSSTRYVRDMDLKMKELDAAKKSVEEHVKRNKSKHLEIPSEVVNDWLKEVEVIKTKVEDNRIDVGGCFNFKIKHKVGREAFKIIEEIKSLKTRHELINWTDEPKLLGEPDSIVHGLPHPREFASREKSFNEALKALRPNHGSHMIALCGMAGVGKTTMMKQLKNEVIQERMFSFYVEVVIGENTDPIAIQQAVADYFSITLQEKTKETRAARLRTYFKNLVKEESPETVLAEKTDPIALQEKTTLARDKQPNECNGVPSDPGNSKMLVILDDVWESVDLNDIGLSPSPNQGVNFKVLLTSRDRGVCTRMGVKSASIIYVEVLTDHEAQELFDHSVKDSDDLDPGFHETRVNIVRKCEGLPLAIKTIAFYLRGKSKATWDDALRCLEFGDTKDIMPKIFDMSYKNLNSDTQSVLLLCGMYPEDFSIPTEDLVRYAWGLKLFKKVYMIKQARDKLNTCIEQLIDANLLIGTDGAGWVKMHDLVRGFVLTVITQDDFSIVNHGSMADWPATSTSCKRLSLTCKGMFEFIGEYMKYPNLTLLKIMFGDNLLRHTKDFYGEMKNLQVIAYESTHYLAFGRSLQCSTSLRTLCLEGCSLTFDYSFIGELLNLEVLSFARSRIRELPSIIRNLKKLKLLDMTGCDNLHIDISVLKGLDKLEELYARVRDTDNYGRPTDYRKAINFSDGTSNDLAKFLKKLSALEVELFDNNAQSIKMLFEKLTRFNISLGCFSKNMGENLLPSENKLMLVTTIGELLGSGMIKLFETTKVLHLEVSDMNDLEQVVDVKPSNTPQQSLFSSLRFLSVSRCEELTYLFTYRVTSNLSMLEDLKISSCNKLKMLIHVKDGESKKITFPKLKRLILKDLMQLSSLCHTSNVIELPELIELEISELPMITGIFPQNKLATSSSSSSDEVQLPLFKEEVVVSKLTKITVVNCESLVNLFPINPMSLLCSLKDLEVRNCGSIEVLFNLDLGCFSENQGKSSLRRISVSGLKKLKQVLKVKGVHNSTLPINSFQALEDLTIKGYGSFTNLFTLTTTKMTDNNSKKETVEVTKDIPNEAMFLIDIEGASSSRDLGNNKQALLPNLKQLNVCEIQDMRHVWKCYNWNKFFIHHQPPNSSSFHNLSVIYVFECQNLRYLFSPLMLQQLLNLKSLRVAMCYGIEEVVSDRDDENNEMYFTSISTHTNSSYPLLDDLKLLHDYGLRKIDGERTRAGVNFEHHTQVDVPLRSLCQYSRRIQIKFCIGLSCLIPSHVVTRLENLEELTADYCHGATEVFETEGDSGLKVKATVTADYCHVVTSQRFPNMINTPQLCNLRKLGMHRCDRLTYIFTFSTLESLKKLSELEIYWCVGIQVIVKEEDGADTSKVVFFPCLKSLKLIDLPNLEAFFKGKNQFNWLLLEEVEITLCPKITRLTHGFSASPNLKYIETECGKYSPHERGLNFEMNNALQEIPLSDIMNLPVADRLRLIPWSVSDLIHIHIDGRLVLFSLQQKHLQKIEGALEELFLATSSSSNEPVLPAVIELPNLTKIYLRYLPRLECIRKRNQPRVLKFPNLTRLSIIECESLGHVLSYSMVGSLSQLQELKINDCKAMKAIFEEEEECDDKAKNQIEFRSLKSIILERLSTLQGFCLGRHDFQWPSLLTLEINDCPSLNVFTKGRSTAPKLKVIDTDYGTFDAKKDPNTIISSIQEARDTQIGMQLTRVGIHEEHID